MVVNWPCQTILDARKNLCVVENNAQVHKHTSEGPDFFFTTPYYYCNSYLSQQSFTTLCCVVCDIYIAIHGYIMF